MIHCMTNDLYCCGKHSNLEYQGEIFKLITKSNAKERLDVVLGVNFMTLTILNFDVFHCTLKVNIK